MLKAGIISENREYWTWQDHRTSTSKQRTFSQLHVEEYCKFGELLPSSAHHLSFCLLIDNDGIQFLGDCCKNLEQLLSPTFLRC